MSYLVLQLLPVWISFFVHKDLMLIKLFMYCNPTPQQLKKKTKMLNIIKILKTLKIQCSIEEASLLQLQDP